ncbi:hypothetical protein [Egbenema bharatensis]|uniref:hypothetical protein n=1 Tax=Egbenema bharatensis TaxID=3463334 RepID=UPI003A86E74F
MTVRYVEGLDYTLIVVLAHNRGIDRSTVQVKDLTGRVFETWHRRYRLWRNPVHGTARSIAEIKEIYNALDIDDYTDQNGYAD